MADKMPEDNTLAILAGAVVGAAGHGIGRAKWKKSKLENPGDEDKEFFFNLELQQISSIAAAAPLIKQLPPVVHGLGLGIGLPGVATFVEVQATDWMTEEEEEEEE